MFTKSLAKRPHLQLAAYAFISLYKPVLVIHHNAILLFTLGVITKGYRNALGLKENMERESMNAGIYKK